MKIQKAIILKMKIVIYPFYISRKCRMKILKLVIKQFIHNVNVDESKTAKP